MSYYFPLGANASLSVQNINYALQAVTASVGTNFAQITVPTASFAPSVETAPPNGTNGTSKVLADCPNTAPQGAQGGAGPQGSKGIAAGFCPAGTKACPGLDGDLVAVNAARADGNRFIYVCIETAGYVASSVTCPGTLPTSIDYVTPTIPDP